MLVDLPGFQKPFDRLTERMQRAVDETLADADVAVLMLDATTPPGPGDRYVAERVLRPGGAPGLIVLNKVDLHAAAGDRPRPSQPPPRSASSTPCTRSAR